MATVKKTAPKGAAGAAKGGKKADGKADTAKAVPAFIKAKKK